MTRIKVTVLRGGHPGAYEESLKTGGYVLSLLRSMPDEYEPVDVFISKEGDWYRGGLADEPRRILSRTDVVWNALHGEYGESGDVQRLLESLQVPFTGSNAGPSAFAHNKDLAKALYRQHEIPTPTSFIIREGFSDEELVKIFRNSIPPMVVKPATGVRGVGLKMVRTFQEMKDAVMKSFDYGPKVIIEQYVGGTVVSVSIIEQAKGQKLYALVPTHLDTEYRRVRPRPDENRKMEEYAKRAHMALGLRHYSSSDFIITPKGKIYILETNSQPLFHEDTLLHRSLESSGWQPKDFADHCLKLALNK